MIWSTLQSLWEHYQHLVFIDNFDIISAYYAAVANQSYFSSEINFSFSFYIILR